MYWAFTYAFNLKLVSFKTPKESRGLLTASLAAAVHRGHPQVGGTGVKDHTEGLWGGSNGDHTIVRQLE